MSPTADIAGFAAAQQRLRGQFGEAVVFYAEAVETWPPGTPLDPESGRPFDPAIAPVTTNAATTTVSCNVVFRSAVEGQQEAAALGIGERTHVMVIADIASRAAIEAAVEFTVRGERFKLETSKPDGIGGVQRFLAWGRRK